MRQLRLIALALVLFVVPAPAQRPSGGNWIVVTPDRFNAALAPLVAWRRQQGMHVAVVDSLKAALKLKPTYLLLVGDVPAAGEAADATDGPPTVMCKPYRFSERQHATFASDHAHADLFYNGPEFPVGRIPFREVEKVATVVKKIIAYEKRPMRISDLRVVTWGGASGAGKKVDRRLTTLMRNTIINATPEWADPWLITGMLESPHCGWPYDQPGLFHESIRRGAVLSAIGAHAASTYVHLMRHEKRSIVYSADHVAKLEGDAPLAPMVILACNAGRFVEKKPCVAELLLAHPGGPVATVAATTLSHGVPNFYTGRALLNRLTDRRHDTVGRLLFQYVRGKPNLIVELALRDVGGKKDLDPKRLERDQRLMYAMFGDPATRLKRPYGRPLAFTVEENREWRAWIPKDATRVAVGFRPRGVVHPKSGVPADPDAARRRFERANGALAYGALPFDRRPNSVRGVVKAPGELRVVAETASGVRVGVVTIH